MLRNCPARSCVKMGAMPLQATFSFVALVLLDALAGCRGEHKKVIAVIPKATAHLFFVSIHAGVDAAAEDMGVGA